MKKRGQMQETLLRKNQPKLSNLAIRTGTGGSGVKRGVRRSYSRLFHSFRLSKRCAINSKRKLKGGIGLGRKILSINKVSK